MRHRWNIDNAECEKRFNLEHAAKIIPKRRTQEIGTSRLAVEDTPLDITQERLRSQRNSRRAIGENQRNGQMDCEGRRSRSSALEERERREEGSLIGRWVRVRRRRLGD